jgi:mono/diheme cytochrome c family protein
MRTRVLVLVALAALPALLGGCGRGTVVAPTAVTVIGAIPTAGPVKGDSVAGHKLYDSSGCGGCHTFKPAGSTGTVGPNLDNLAADATKANQGGVDLYTFTSIKNPDAYVVPGYQAGVMPSYGGQLNDRQIADITAFLTQSS